MPGSEGIPHWLLHHLSHQSFGILQSNVSNDRVGTPARQVRTQLPCRGWRLRSIALFASATHGHRLSLIASHSKPTKNVLKTAGLIVYWFLLQARSLAQTHPLRKRSASALCHNKSPEVYAVSGMHTAIRAVLELNKALCNHATNHRVNLITTFERAHVTSTTGCAHLQYSPRIIVNLFEVSRSLKAEQYLQFRCHSPRTSAMSGPAPVARRVRTQLPCRG